MHGLTDTQRKTCDRYVSAYGRPLCTIGSVDRRDMLRADDEHLCATCPHRQPTTPPNKDPTT